MRFGFAFGPLLCVTACSGGALNIPGKVKQECPQIQLSTDSIRFENGRLGLPSVQTVDITNTCSKGDDVALDVRFTPTSAAFTIQHVDTVIGPNEQGSLSIQYTPYDYAPVSTVVELTSNDPNQPIVRVVIEGVMYPDQDGDGVDAVEAGGTDCDDTNPEVYPGAVEQYYDGIDSDCDGASDFDQDKDGHDRIPEGLDCDDTTVLVSPDMSEVRNLIDDDCDGLADEDWLQPHMVRITEVMIDPYAVFDSTGEWFELVNISDQSVNLLGWTISDDSGDSFVVSESVVIPSQATVVLGNNGDIMANGGITVAYAYPADAFYLSNQSDAIVIYAGDVPMDSLRYSGGWPVTGGATMMFDEWYLYADVDASRPEFWCASQTPQSSGDFGTPGTSNGYCTTIDHDGDGYTAEQGDCNDFDVLVSPAQKDLMNGVDDDCDGRVDHTDIGSIYRAKLEGPTAGAHLAAPNALSIADVTNDGVPEIIIGAPLQTTSPGEVYLIQGTSVYGTSGKVSAHATSTIDGASNTYQAFGRMPERLGDNTGDGVADLLLVGSRGYPATGTHAALFSGGGVYTSSMEIDDATVTWTGSLDSSYLFGEALSATDMNGDGADEVLLAYPYHGDGYSYEGAVGVFDASNMSAGNYDQEDADWLLLGDKSYQYLGSHLSGHDADDDGYDDALLCGRGYRWSSSSVYSDAACYLVMGRAALGSEDDVTDVARITFTEPLFSSEEYGTSTAFGDIDDDGTVDMAIAAPGRNDVYVYLDVASLAGTVGTNDADYTIEGWSSPDYFGQSLAMGDVNDDGIDDLVIGAPDIGIQAVSYVGDEAGVVYVFEGGTVSASTLTEADAAWTIDGDDVGDAFGYELRMSDIDVDGDVDIVISAPKDNSLSGVLYFVDLGL